MSLSSLSFIYANLIITRIFYFANFGGRLLEIQQKKTILRNLLFLQLTL